MMVVDSHFIAHNKYFIARYGSDEKLIELYRHWDFIVFSNHSINFNKNIRNSNFIQEDRSIRTTDGYLWSANVIPWN